MADTRYIKVRVKGTNLVGTRAFRNESPFQYYATSGGRNSAIAPVYFEETGELRFFNETALEEASEE